MKPASLPLCAIAFLTTLFVSCTPIIGTSEETTLITLDGAGGTSGTGGSSGSGGGSGTSTVITPNENAVYLGQTSERIDDTMYTVKSYADVYAVEPYFYTYYKYYYLNGKIRRVCVFYHGPGANLDYKYTEFVEHTCGNSSTRIVYTYYENGNLESYSSTSGKDYFFQNQYDSSGHLLYSKTYTNEKLSTLTEYYPSGTTKSNKLYTTDVSPSYLWSETTYYENGKEEYRIDYSPKGTETRKGYYTYYANGNKKTWDIWENGVLSYSYTYYDDASTTTKSRLEYNTTTGFLSGAYYYYPNGTKQLEVRYNTDSSIDYFTHYYSSGYTQCYYTDSGYFYTYEDGKATGTWAGDSNSKTAYTEEQAQNKLAELKELL